MNQPEPLTRRVLRALCQAAEERRTVTRAELFRLAKCSPESEITRAARDLRKDPYSLIVRCAKLAGSKYPSYWLAEDPKNLKRAASFLGEAKKGVAA